MAYRPEKLARDYCGKCGSANNGEVNGVARCPARNAFNSDWFDSTRPFGTFQSPSQRQFQEDLQRRQQQR